MKPHTLFEIEDFQRDDLTIQVQIEGRGAIDIPRPAYEKFLKDSGRLNIYDPENPIKFWGQMNAELYWDCKSEFFIANDLYEYIIRNHDLVHEILMA
jgi:hypothetical protein